jgi:hypothetical protein
VFSTKKHKEFNMFGFLGKLAGTLAGSIGGGVSKQKGTKNSTIDEVLNQVQESSGSSNTNKNSVSNTSAQSAQTGDKQQTQNSNAVSSTSQLGQQKQSVSGNSLSNLGLAAGDNYIQSLAGVGTQQVDLNNFLSQNSVQQLKNFDSGAFVQNALNTAGLNLNEQTSQGIAGLSNTVGGNQNSNSMIALLAQKAQRDNQVSLGQVRNDATAQANSIQSALLQNANQLGNTNGNSLLTGLNVLKGSVNTQTGLTENSNTQQQQSNEQQSLSSVDRILQQSNQSTVSADVINTLTAELAKLNSNKKTNEDTKTTGSGFNLSASVGK